MKIVGLIVEYNPLHNGHKYHIEKVRKESNADILIAVMSSSFTMRGELSLFDKFTKTHQALSSNIDIVIELPFILTVQNSDLFAKHAVTLLNLAKVNEIWIGSESNDPYLYEKCYNEFNNEDNQLKIKELLKSGLSYKMATNTIYNLPSNDLLGYSYYKAIKDNNYNITLNTIKRIGDNYLDNKNTDALYTSALSIRTNLDLLDTYTPLYVSNNKENILDYNKLFNYLKFNILNNTVTNLSNIFFAEEGIENKLFDIIKYDNFDDFVSYLTSKRYTSSRIRRFLLFVLFNITKDDANNILNSNIDFIRVLGFNEKGKEYLSSIKKDVKIYTNIKNGINPILDIELKISKILDMIYQTNIFTKEQQKPIYIE